MQITPLRRADIPELSQFLLSDRSDGAPAPHFSHEVLSWKYLDGPSGPSEDSVRSLVVRAAGKIIGHIGMCHRQLFVSGHGTTHVSTLHAIDWHSSAAHPGSGALLMLRAFATSQTQYALGGSAQAQALFPRLGFEQKPGVAVFRKVLTPFHRLRSTGQGLFRKWAGTAKDMVSVWCERRPPVAQTVELRPAQTFTEEIDCLHRRSSPHMVTCQRDHLLLNYFLRCPLSGFSGWTIHTSERMIGFAVLKITPHGRVQLGKIVDCWLDTEDLSYWETTVEVLVGRLRALSADSVTCYGTTPSLHAALLRNGFAKSGNRKVFFRDKQQLLPHDFSFGLSMLEGDHAIH
jgi:hypothetical protein